MTRNTIRFALLAVAAAVMLLAVGVPSTSAHKLTWKRASIFMRSVALADHRSSAITTDWNGFCKSRFSRHGYSCREYLWFNPGGRTYTYGGKDWEYCTQDGVVRFRSARTRRLHFVYEPYVCHSDTKPTAAPTAPLKPPPTSQPVVTPNGGQQWKWLWNGAAAPLQRWPTFFTPTT
jgi:hypothetical protein